MTKTDAKDVFIKGARGDHVTRFSFLISDKTLECRFILLACDIPEVKVKLAGTWLISPNEF